MQGPGRARVVVRKRTRHTQADAVSLRALEVPGLPTWHGLTLACNEERLPPGAGYAPHRHEGIDLVSWVIQGTLAHEADDGVVTLLQPGAAQVLRTGRGTSHAERNGGHTSLRFVQVHLPAASAGEEPAYAVSVESSVRSSLASANPGVTCIASGVATEPAPLRVGCPASVHAGRLDGGSAEVVLPEGAFTFMLVVDGGAVLDDDVLRAGDSLRVTGGDPVTARGSATIVAIVSHAALAPAWMRR